MTPKYSRITDSTFSHQGLKSEKIQNFGNQFWQISMKYQHFVKICLKKRSTISEKRELEIYFSF